MRLTLALALVALAACGGETFDVGLCPSPELTLRDGAVLGRVHIVRMGFQEVEGDSVVSEEVVQGSADGFVAEGVATSDARVSIWVEGLESADSTHPIVTGATPGPTRVAGIRPVCICITEPAAWDDECQGVSCVFDGGSCVFP